MSQAQCQSTTRAPLAAFGRVCSIGSKVQHIWQGNNFNASMKFSKHICRRQCNDIGCVWRTKFMHTQTRRILLFFPTSKEFLAFPASMAVLWWDCLKKAPCETCTAALYREALSAFSCCDSSPITENNLMMCWRRFKPTMRPVADQK